MRLIDGDALIETVNNAIYRYWNENGGGYYLAEDAIEDIENAPTIAPTSLVKRGRWGELEWHKNTPSLNGYPCSECGQRQQTKTPHCPICGALMED